MILEEVHIHFFWLDGNVSDDAATDKTVLDAQEVRALFGVVNRDVVELEVQKLVNADKCAVHDDVVLEFNLDLASNKSFKEGIK